MEQLLKRSTSFFLGEGHELMEDAWEGAGIPV